MRAHRRKIANVPHGRRPDRGREDKPLWLFLTEPGLASLATRELKFVDAVTQKAQFAKLHLRNYDLLVAPDAIVRPRLPALRLTSHVLLSPVFGRERVSERQLDLLAERVRREGSASLARFIAGDALSGRDFEQFVMRGLAERGVRFAHASDKPVWLLAVDEKYYFGFPRFNFHDVPGRQWTSEREGSLPPVVAAAMVFAAKPGKGEVIWDPVMGTGTVLNEAAHMAPDAHLIGSDVDSEAVDLATKRLGRGRGRLFQGDVARARPGESVSLTVANLPFGKRFKPAGGNALFYETVLRRSLEHSGNTWRGCFLTSDAGSLRTAVEAIGGLAISEVARPTVRGTPAAILIVNRA